MAKINSFVLGFVLLSGNSSLLAQEVTFETPVLVPNMSSQPAGAPVCIDSTGLLVADCDAAGSTGPIGPTGPAGPAGDAGHTLERSQSVDIGFLGRTTINLGCPGSTKVLSGGASISGYSLAPPSILRSYPSSDTQWTVEVKNNESLLAITAIAWAVCTNTD